MTPLLITVRSFGPGRAVEEPVYADHVEGGLAIHRGVHQDAHGYVITHVASGQRMGPVYPVPASAMPALQRLLGLGIDWTLPREKLPTDDLQFRDRVRVALGGVLSRCEDPDFPDDEDHL